MAEAPAAPKGRALQVRRRPRVALAGWGLGLLVVAAVVWWVSTHPADLPTSTTTISASTPVGQPVFVGVFTAAADSDRTLHLSGVKIFATSTVADVEITPHLCRGGSVSVTADPAPFCTELDSTEGTTMGAGDEIVLEVSGPAPGAVAIDRVRLAYREGVQWGTQDAGAPALVTLIPRGAAD
jgi:hypothetical protein